MRIGSGKSWSVNATEWFQPFRAFVRYLRIRPCGVWQSLHVATAACAERCYAS